MIKVIDLPTDVQETVMAFTDFIRVNDGEGNYTKKSYEQLLEDFTEDMFAGNTLDITNEEEDYFDFEFGVLGGTFAKDNENGNAILDCLQWYKTPDNQDLELPTSVEIDKDQIDYGDDEDDLDDVLGDYLSDEYGYCHNSFDYEEHDKTINITKIDWDLSGEEPIVVNIDCKNM